MSRPRRDRTNAGAAHTDTGGRPIVDRDGRLVTGARTETPAEPEQDSERTDA